MKINKLKKTLKVILLLSLIASMGMVTGCSDDNSLDVSTQKEYKNISLSWWGTDARNQYTLDAVKVFEDLHPDIKVETKYGDWSGYEKRMDIEVASDTEADVMQINYAWINKYCKNEQEFYDLNELSDIIDLSQFSDEILEYGMSDDKLMAVPIALNAVTMYYNKDLYDKYELDIPTKLSDLYAAAKIMSKDGVYPMSCSDKALWFLCVSLAESESGNKLYGEDNQIEFTNENLESVIDYATDLIQNKVTPELTLYDKSNIGNGKYAGAALWISDGASSFTSAEENGYEFVVGDYLQNDKADNISWYVKPATMYAISAETEYPEESALLLDFLLNSKEMAEEQGIEKGIPVSKKALGILEEENMLQGIQYEAYKKLDSNMSTVTKISPYMENTDLISVFTDCVSQVLYADKSSAEVTEELMKALKSASE